MSADPTMPTLTLSTGVDQLPNVRLRALNRLGIRTVADLIKHLPYRWEYHAGRTPIAQLPRDTIATVVGEIAKCRWVPAGRQMFRGTKGRFQATVEDDTGQIDAVWFNAGYLRDKLSPGMRVEMTGKVGIYKDHPQMTNPRFRILEDDAPPPPEVEKDNRYRPVYPATEDLQSDRIEQMIAVVLPGVLPQIQDHLDDTYRRQRAMHGLRDAYRMMHAPADEDEPKQARRRLAYDELLLLQLGLVMKRHHTRTQLKSPALRYSHAIDRHIRDRFPFSLTEAQEQVVKQIAADLQKTEPMNRLLQGDVGSGKTVVALYAMLMAVADRRQAALMAPTELLAEQHYQSITAMLAGSSVSMALLTGSLAAAERDAARRAIEAGRIDIVIGTQALLTETVQFRDLAVVVVDEQHRFGVEQRATIRSKSSDATTVPHTLVMTATPIPRTLSLALFGDLDVSTITALPPGRRPITTRVVGPQKTEEVYRYLAGRVDKGEQLYVVVPAIEQGEKNLKAVRSHAGELAATWFKNRRVASIHGQMKPDTRRRIMDRFRRGEIHVLVATTVIEVGVDVPNASLMVVEHADRFGLAQLHQLRGRIGRGTRRSLCVFIAEPTTDDAQQRIKAIAATDDGFRIAEHDLEIRGMGELIGTRQSGLPPMKIADIAEDIELLKLARHDAMKLVESDPNLAQPSHTLLRQRLIKAYGEALGLGDVM